MKNLSFDEMRVKITGLNMLRMINRSAKEGVEFSRIIKTSNKEVIVFIKKTDYKKLLSITDEMCYNIEVLEHTAWDRFRSWFKNRFAVIAGLIACAALLVTYNLFVWNIDIIADDVQSEQAARLLKENGIGTGTFKFNINTDNLRSILETGIADSNKVRVSLQGTQLKVEMERLVGSIDDIEVKEGNDIIAAFDCRIERIIIMSGTAVVKAGEFVKAGEIIVAGYSEEYEGSEIKQKPVKANAVVYGSVWFTSNKVFTNSELLETETGNFIKQRELWIGGFKFGGKTPVLDYKNYKTVKTITTFTRGLFIPVRIEETIYKETVSQIVESDFEILKEKYYKQTLNDALSKVPAGATVMESYNNAKVETEYIKIEGVVRAQLIISQTLKSDAA